jgi:23S rRNA (uracil1939-C5)-methyltransferase
MRFGLSDRLLSEIAELARMHGLDRVVLFGSRAREDYRERSDIDLAVSGGDVNAFAVDVEAETHTLLPFDVVNLDGSVQRELLESIAQEGRVIYEKV